MPELVSLAGGDRWRVGETEFQFGGSLGSTPDRFMIRKPDELMQRHVALCEQHRGANIFELGIAAGGSTSLMALLAAPRKLVACELAVEPVPALATFIERQGLERVVSTYFGQDQADQRALASIYEAEFGGEPLDLVIDDASHVYRPTRASFEVLFPLLRPGGTYVIEDWAADFAYAAALADASSADFDARQGAVEAALAEMPAGQVHRPLPTLALDLTLATAMAEAVVREVRIDHHWITVTRGPAALGPGPLDLGALATDHFGWLG